MNRRTLLKAAAGSVVLSAAPGVAFGATGNGRRVYVVVLDGLRPDEAGQALTPNLLALRQEGTYFPLSMPLPIPNHVKMMASVLERLKELGFRTGAVLSKEHPHGELGTRASYRWVPKPVLPAAGHAPDAFTSHALHAMIDEADPDLVFVNFGDCDPATGVARPLDVRTSDEQLGKLVRHLRTTGRWERSVLVVIAGWSPLSLRCHIDADPLLRGKVAISRNGGVDLLTWAGPASDRAVASKHLASVISRVPGVLSVHSPEVGALVVSHAGTAPVPLLIAGGDPVVGRGVSAAPVSTVDVAPTVGRLFGLPEPSGGYDGTSII